MPAVRFCCSADVTGDPDAATSKGDVPLPVPMGNPTDALGTMRSGRGLEQGDKADLEGFFGPESSPVKVVVDPDEPAASEVLRDFVNVFEDGATEFCGRH